MTPLSSQPVELAARYHLLTISRGLSLEFLADWLLQETLEDIQQQIAREIGRRSGAAC